MADKQVLLSGRDNFMQCEDGGAHSWVYRGKASQEYRCVRCGAHALKKDLKEETD